MATTTNIWPLFTWYTFNLKLNWNRLRKLFEIWATFVTVSFYLKCENISIVTKSKSTTEWNFDSPSGCNSANCCCEINANACNFHFDFNVLFEIWHSCINLPRSVFLTGYVDTYYSYLRNYSNYIGRSSKIKYFPSFYHIH